jgi:hypothetical protein
MSVLWVVGELVLAASLTFSILLVVVIICLDRRDRHRERAATVYRHPIAIRGVAIFCGSCGRPVRYQVHPAGRRDAVRLHAQFECDQQTARRTT